MKPTVSENKTLRFEGSSTPRIVGSSVANMRDDATTLDLVSALNSVDFPAFVYPTSATVATGTDSRRCLCCARMRRTFSICCLTCRTRR